MAHNGSIVENNHDGKGGKDSARSRNAFTDTKDNSAGRGGEGRLQSIHQPPRLNNSPERFSSSISHLKPKQPALP